MCTDDREDTSVITETPSSPSIIYVTSTAEGSSFTSTREYTSYALQTTAVKIFGVIEPDGSTSFGTTQIAVATSTASGNRDTSSTNTGAVIGATVGIVLGVLLLCGVTLLLFLRRRQSKKSKSETQYTTQDGDDPTKTEKAQLHSDDIKPVRKELEGDVPNKKDERIEEVVEMPANEPVEGAKELPANEIMGSEMDATKNNRFTKNELVERKDSLRRR